MTAALEVRGLSVSAGDTRLLRDISFRIEEGETLVVLGESGSGKSLLAQSIMGSLPHELASTGTIAIRDQLSETGSRAREKLWGRKIALLPQEPWLALDPTMRVLDQVAEGYLTQDGEKSARADLADLNLTGAERKFPFALSGGMAQRVAFAATRAGRAPLLIADEPTKGLDAKARASILATLKHAIGKGLTLVVITHDIEVARELNGRILVVKNGEIVEDGSSADVLQNPRHEYSRRLLAADPRAWPSRAAPVIGPPVLTGNGLCKRFGERTLFQNFDLTVRAGERIAITGPSGSGKTTLGNILLGFVIPDGGRVTRTSNLPDIRFQKLYQDPPASFAPNVPMGQLLDELLSYHRLDKARVSSLMDRLRLSSLLLHRTARQLSGGELQRFALIRVLLLKPIVILADEPTSRLDPITQQETIDLLVEHSADTGSALLLITHDTAIAGNVARQRTIEIANAEEANG